MSEVVERTKTEKRASQEGERETRSLVSGLS